MMSLNCIVRKSITGKVFAKSREKIIHMMNRDDIKLLSKNETVVSW